MSEQSQRDEVARKRVVYRLPGMDGVGVRSLEYRASDGATSTMDVYQPTDLKPGELRSAVVVCG